MPASENARLLEVSSFDPTDIAPTTVVKRPNLDAFADDQQSFRLLALEDYDDKTGAATKRRLFRESI